MKKFILVSLVGMTLNGSSLRAEEDGIEARRGALGKWVETKRLISEERQDWRTGREILHDRIDLIRHETRSLQEKTDEARKGIGEVDTKLAELRGKNEELKHATTGLQENLKSLEDRVKTLLAHSPAPIRERVKPLSQRIPENADDTKLSLSERFQNVLGILNEMNKFSREITEASEVRDLPDGSHAEVTVLYLGVGQAYFCNENGGVAGVGRAGPDGWTWQQSNELVQAVAEVIAVYRNEQPATYVSLPVEVQ